jgi:hypothetical protein
MIVDLSAYLTVTDTYVDWEVSLVVFDVMTITVHGTVAHPGGYSEVLIPPS